jgi:hypothetical protein
MLIVVVTVVHTYLWNPSPAKRYGGRI